jgi:penicillin-insensitive murein endopeptidase
MPRVSTGRRAAVAAAIALLVIAYWFGNAVGIALESDARSRSLGTPSHGRLENGRRLPTEGANFRAHSRLGAALGRNTVHQTVRDVVVEAYGELAISRPELAFVYGETGLPGGGPFRPHRTHQNGLSVDFMVPVRDGSGGSVPLPTAPWTKFGYGLEFDRQGLRGDLAIDFEALAAHLAALERAAAAHGTRVELLILAPEYLDLLWRTPTGRELRGRIPVLSRPAWVRHDEHYHVDFANPDE